MGKKIKSYFYGASSDGIRAVGQLRQVIIKLRMIPLRESVAIPFVRDAFAKSDKLKNPEHLERSLKTTLIGLENYFK
jgi:hypothetical protein